MNWTNIPRRPRRRPSVPTPPPVPALKGWAWAVEFARTNPLAVGWNAVLLCGGVVLLLYHWSITYLPDFSLSDLAGLLASVTLIGILFIVFMASACLLPAFALYSFDKETQACGTMERSFFGKRDNALLGLFPLLMWTLFLGPALFLESGTEFYRGYFPAGAIVVMLVLAGLACAFVKPVPPVLIVGPHRQWTRSREFFRRFCGLIFWVFAFFMPLYMAVMFASTGEQEREWLALITGTVLFVAINLAAYFPIARNWWQPLAIGGFIIMVVLPQLAGRPMLWPQAIVQTLSLGNRNAAEIVLSYKQCQSIEKFGATCDYEKNGESQISLRNVNILSRIGTSVLIEVMVEAVDLPLAANAGRNTLSTSEFERYCPDSMADGVRLRCSQCDKVTLEKSRGTAAGKDEEARRKNFRDGLICVQTAIPKDQVTSISWSDRRQYSGFTSFSLPARPVGKH